jgi:4-hydroxy-tetrahydrodipicolinate synthase
MPSGIIVPIITPFNRDGSIDWPAYERVVDHVIGGGVDAIFVLGATGEGPSLGTEEQRELIKATQKHVAGRCAVYVGVTDTSLTESLHMAGHACECGADAAVIAPAPYFPATPAGQIQYFSAFVEKSALPVILYNIPQMTKVNIDLGAFDALIDNRKIIGVKDSSGNMVYFQRLLHLARRRPDFSMLIGAEELLAESVLMGAHGGVTGGANLFPELYRDLFAAAKARDFSALDRLQARLMTLSCKLYAFSGGGYIIQGIKAALAAKGICQPWMQPPMLAAEDTLNAVIDGVIKEYAQPSR